MAADEADALIVLQTLYDKYRREPTPELKKAIISLEDALDLSAGDTFEGLIEEAEQFLLPRLLDGGGKP